MSVPFCDSFLHGQLFYRRIAVTDVVTYRREYRPIKDGEGIDAAVKKPGTYGLDGQLSQICLCLVPTR